MEYLVTFIAPIVRQRSAHQCFVLSRVGSNENIVRLSSKKKPRHSVSLEFCCDRKLLSFFSWPKGEVHLFLDMKGCAKGLCKVKKNSKNPKKIGSGWMGPGPIWIKKKLENRPKNTFCVGTIRPCLAVHVAPQCVHACSILSRIL